MVGNRPVLGVRNRVCFTSIASSFVRAKNAGHEFARIRRQTTSRNLHRRVSPVRLLEEVFADILCGEHGRVNLREDVGRGTGTPQFVQDLCLGQLPATKSRL